MTKLLSGYRLVPVLLLAACSLFALKATGVILGGGYTLGERMASRGTETMTITVPASPATLLRSQTVALDPGGSGAKPWMKEMFYPDVTGSVSKLPRPTPARADGITTGSVDAPKPSAGVQAPETQPVALKTSSQPPANPAAATAPGGPISQAERAILERLQQRRQEIESRDRELELRETMIKAAERRLESRLKEIKDVEGRITTGMQKRDEAEATRLKSIVTMYESMKPKEAARIFDRLDPRVLLEVAGQIAPRKMSEILAQMSPELAEKLTVEMASRASSDRSRSINDLPKIEGRPTGG